MAKRKKPSRNRQGLQAVTLCISTALVLILLGIVSLSVLTGRNLSNYVKENLVVALMLQQDMTTPEAQQLYKRLQTRPYTKKLTYVSKEQALKESIKAMGINPTEFVGENPFPSSIELTLKGDYANNDSLAWIAKELQKYPKVSEVNYQKDLINDVNQTLANISIVLLILAGLLTFVSFALINNTIRLGIYAKRFTIRTMKLVGAPWKFIRRPYLRQAVLVGLIAAFVACLVIGAGIYALYYNEPAIAEVLTWKELAITAGVLFLVGIFITLICAHISVNKFLRMKADELYKI